MGRSAPGYESIEDDIELIGMDDLADRPDTQKQNGIQWHAKPGEDSEDEIDAEGEEGSRGLLSGQHDWTPTREQFLKPIGTVWPHVRGIVIEVCGTVILLSARAEEREIVECTYPLTQYYQSSFYRETIRSSLCT